MRKSQTGFAVIELVVLVVVLALAGGAGYYIWHTNQQSQVKLDAAKKATQSSNHISTKSTDPTATWTKYSNKDGGFSLKYPSSWLTAYSCTTSAVLLAPSSSVRVDCNSAKVNQGYIEEIYVGPAFRFGCIPLSLKDGFTNIQQQSVKTSSGVTATEYTAASNGNSGSLFMKGTNVNDYYFTVNGKCYEANYTQFPGYPDVSSDFNLMITKTLKFE